MGRRLAGCARKAIATSVTTVVYTAIATSVVMVAVGSVHMPVRDLFLRCGPDIHDRAVETQPLARKLVIAVEDRFAIRDSGDAPHDFVTVLLGDEMAADRDVRRQIGERLDPDHLRIVFAERVLRLQRDRDGVAHLFVRQRLLDLRKNARMPAVQIDQRLRRFLDQLVVRIEQLKEMVTAVLAKMFIGEVRGCGKG